MDDQNKNLILATALSFVVILVWFVMFPPPEPAGVQPERVLANISARGTTFVGCMRSRPPVPAATRGARPETAATRVAPPRR